MIGDSPWITAHSDLACRLLFETPPTKRELQLRAAVHVEVLVPKEVQGHSALVVSPHLNRTGSTVYQRLTIWTQDGNERDPKPLNMMTMNRYMKRLCKAANVPLIKVHDLRHTSATLMLEAGVSPKVMQERLGHADIKMTLDTYTHVSKNMQKDAATKFAKLLHG